MKRFILVAVASTLLGCANEGEPVAGIQLSEASETEIHDVTPATIAALAPEERLLVDLTAPGNVWRFLPAGAPVDFARVDLLCPNGVAMPMHAWLAERAVEFRFDLEVARARSVVLTEIGSHDAANDIQGPCSDCYQCSDGAYVCTVQGCSSGPGSEPSLNDFNQDGVPIDIW